VLSGIAQQQDREVLENDLRNQAHVVNETVEKHARIGALIVCTQPWTIENGVLTPTLKIKRDQVEMLFNERAQAMAHTAAVEGQLLVAWDE
jgi:long-chain acyl-CoA synthetase